MKNSEKVTIKRILLSFVILLVTFTFIAPLAFSYISAWSPWLIIPIVLYIIYKILTKKQKENETEI